VSLLRPRDEGERWVQLSLVMVVLVMLMLAFLAVIPSAWLYFADSTVRQWGFFADLTSLQFLVFRDVVAVLLYGVALAAGGLAVRVYNRRNPKELPADEPRREATGGYK